MSVRAIRRLQDLDAVRSHWEQWQDHTNSDLAQFELVCRLRSEVESPLVTVIEQDGRPCALLLGRLERSEFAPSIGYLRPVRVPARVLVVIHQGVVGRMDDAAACQAIGFLQLLLRSGAADAINFHYLHEHSPLLKSLLVDRNTRLWDRTPRWSTHRGMSLAWDGSFLEKKVSGKHRTQIRKRQKELDASFGGKLVWRWLTDFDDIPALCLRLETVAAKTYQRGLKAGFFDNEEYRRRFELYASRQQLRVQLLEIDGHVRAFWFGTVYRGVFHSSETGYDPALRDFEVGTLMFIRMVDALKQEGVRQLDFGLGDAPYKARFGDLCWRETPVWLFAPSAKGVTLMLLLKLCLQLDKAARSVLERTGLTGRIKSLWRRNIGKGDSKAVEAAGGIR